VRPISPLRRTIVTFYIRLAGFHGVAHRSPRQDLVGMEAGFTGSTRRCRPIVEKFSQAY
jgi:hypothetical protein